MTGLPADLNALARGLQARVVTRAEAAERLQILAARVPTFVVWVADLDRQGAVLCYLSTARRRESALTEARHALGLEAPGHGCVEVTPARPGVIWEWDGIGKK